MTDDNGIKDIAPLVLAQDEEDLDRDPTEGELQELERLRPKYRRDCSSVPRPCPYISCRYNLYRHWSHKKRKLPIIDPADMKPECSCLLDMVDEHGDTPQEEIQELLDMSQPEYKEGIDGALRKLRHHKNANILFPIMNELDIIAGTVGDIEEDGE